MPANVEQLLDEFVNREKEMTRFIKFLEDDSESVLAVWGGGGVGKSSLLAKMWHECSCRRLQKAELSWAERNRSYLEVMRWIRDSFGAGCFEEFTDLTNFFTVPRYELKIKVEGLEKASVLEGAQLENVQIDSVSALSIKDLMIPEPRSDMHVPEEERRTRLTDAFLNGLAKVCEEGQSVVFFDAAEKMTDETQTWLWRELLSIPATKKCPRLKFVICGRKQPDLDRSWRDSAIVRELKPLSQEHIEEYLVNRGVKEGVKVLAEFLTRASKGNMFKVAMDVDAFLTRKPDEEEW